MTPEIIEIYISNNPSVIEIEVPGMTGPQGAAGLSTIGGYSVSVNNLTSGDLLQFQNNNWGNTQQVEITDGGNY